MIWIEDAHRDDGKRFVCYAYELPGGVQELESATRACGELVRISHVRGERRQIKQMSIAFGSLKVAVPLTNNIYSLACDFLQPPLAKFKRRGNTTL